MQEPWTSTQIRLLLFLSVATFFEGYDFLAIAQLLPEIRNEFGLSESQGGMLVTVANLGTVMAFFVVREADKIGRRLILGITILGYTVCSIISAFAPDVYTFGITQFFARVFLIGEWGIAMVYAAEEFPAHRRGVALGLIQACTSLGAIACAALVPKLSMLPMGWRTVYVVGAIPLLMVAYLRRNVGETRRFEQSHAESVPLMAIWGSPYRGRMLKLALIWALTYTCSQSIITFWKEFAMLERGLSSEEVGKAISMAAVVAMPMIFAVGKVLDVIGRRWGAVLVFSGLAIGGFGSYSFHEPWAFKGALILGVFGASAVLPVLNAWSTELFPTELRSNAFGWANNLLGRMANVFVPLGVAFAAEEVGWGRATSMTALAPVVALGLIWVWMPETQNRELEDTARVE